MFFVWLVGWFLGSIPYAFKFGFGVFSVSIFHVFRWFFFQRRGDGFQGFFFLLDIIFLSLFILLNYHETWGRGRFGSSHWILVLQ